VAWLRARHEGGAFVLRVEDLDAPRVRAGAMDAILADLRWMGIDWDEGPDVGGAHAPYVQSERGDRYERAFEALRDGGHLYPCTCSRKEIAEIASAPHGEEPVYPGTCRDGPTHPERAPSWRFRMREVPAFDDAIAGRRVGLGGGDFVVRRADGVWSYQLACVVDDREMEITEVVRGDDLLSSTPRQISLHRALGGEPPAFAHVPLVLGPDGERLSKRHGAISLAEARSAGPDVLVGRLARSLGLAATDAPVCARDLVARFDLAALARDPVRMSPTAGGVPPSGTR
jgi:glutamyl-tRNA synthetase